MSGITAPAGCHTEQWDVSAGIATFGANEAASLIWVGQRYDGTGQVVRDAIDAFARVSTLRTNNAGRIVVTVVGSGVDVFRSGLCRHLGVRRGDRGDGQAQRERGNGGEAGDEHGMSPCRDVNIGEGQGARGPCHASVMRRTGQKQ